MTAPHVPGVPGVPVSKWCVAANVPIPGLPGAAEADLGAVRLYVRGPAGAVLPAAGSSVVLDVRTLTAAAPGSSDADTDDGAVPADTPADAHVAAHAAAHATTIAVTGDTVTVRVSALNENPVYYAANRLRGRFAYFTDLLLAPLVLPALGLPVRVAGRATGAGHEGGTLVAGVDRLRHATVSRTSRTGRAGGGHWSTTVTELADPLAAHRTPHRDDPLAAGEAQLDALAAEIAAVAAAAPDSTRYATLLSGGIDSGTVTYLAATGGLPVTPYSVATPWGDELADAAELCDHLGIALTPIRLTEEQIVGSIPEAVRWLGSAEAEVVEVALTATCVQRLAAVPADRLLLTGYGSDLVNAGLFRPYGHRDELIDQVLESVDRTRRSNELSNRMPLAYGTTTRHPFWSWPVMRTALETAPECKVRDGREKFHLRTAMARRVPEAVAWRRKIAVHPGGGLQQGVANRLEKETGGADRGALYEACFAELLADAGEGRLDPPTDPWELFGRAVRRAGDSG
jgi:hypothetical protein